MVRYGQHAAGWCMSEKIKGISGHISRLSKGRELSGLVLHVKTIVPEYRPMKESGSR